MKRLFTLVIIGMLAFSTPVYASTQTLDEIISEVDSTENQDIPQPDSEQPKTENEIISIPVGLNYIKEANDLGELSSTASKINTQINRFASFVVQVLSYFITAFLSVRILVDLCYIVFPFTRTILNKNGNGEVQSGLSMGNTNTMNSMNPMNNTGNGRIGMGMGSPMQTQGVNQAGRGSSGRSAWVSQAAINAANSEAEGEGTKGVLKMYAKDMIIVLVATPILLVLAVTGTLSNLGFLLGEMISKGIASIGNMV